jgi:hypothetical protein
MASPEPRQPRMQVDRVDPPLPFVIGAWARDVVEPRQRAVVDAEGERPLGLDAERHGERGADRAAMGDGDDVAAAMGGGEAGHGGGDAVDHR